MFLCFPAEDGIRDVAVTVVQTCAPSRRRHTRCSRDWSSDVCSSDLFTNAQLQPNPGTPGAPPDLTNTQYVPLNQGYAAAAQAYQNQLANTQYVPQGQQAVQNPNFIAGIPGQGPAYGPQTQKFATGGSVTNPQNTQAGTPVAVPTTNVPAGQPEIGQFTVEQMYQPGVPIGGTTIAAQTPYDASQDIATGTNINYKPGLHKYIQSIYDYNYKFDVIVIDGVFRFDCIKPALDKIKNDGIIIVDNTDWHRNSKEELDKSDLIPIHFHGFKPLHVDSETTSCYINRKFNKKAKSIIPMAGTVREQHETDKSII